MRHSEMTAYVVACVVALSGCGQTSTSPTPLAPGTIYAINRSNFTHFEFTLVPQLFCLGPGDVRRMELTKGRDGRLSVAFSQITEPYCGGVLAEVLSPDRALTAEEEAAVDAVFRHVEIESALSSCDGWAPVWGGQARWDNRRVYDRSCAVDHLSSLAFGALKGLMDKLAPPAVPADDVPHATSAGRGGCREAS